MHRMHLLVVLLAAALVVPHASAAQDGVRKVYLLESSWGDGYWSVDASDPELQVSSAHRVCGLETEARGAGVCYGFATAGEDSYEYQIPFLPGAVIDPVGEQHTEPMRFRFRLEVGSPQPFTVHAMLQENLFQRVSDPAVEVSPGVFEGTLADAAPFDGTHNTLFVVVRTAAPSTTITVATGGQSWVELARPVSARGVPELQRRDDAGAPVAQYTGAGRTLWFNDSDWSATSFTGDLRQTRSYSVDVPRDARTVIAWVETFDAPVLHDVHSGRAPDARRAENSPYLSLRRGDAEPVRGTNTGIMGRGTDAVAVLDVDAGQVVAEVTSKTWDPDQSGQELGYELHVVAVHGARTLRAMRWRFSTSFSMRTPVAAVCPYALEPVPVPRDVTTFSADLDWRSYALPFANWTLSYHVPDVGDFPCGEGTVGDKVRFTLPPSHRVWMLGPAPQRHATFVSSNDTVYEMQVDYTYAPSGG